MSDLTNTTKKKTAFSSAAHYIADTLLPVTAEIAKFYAIVAGILFMLINEKVSLSILEGYTVDRLADEFLGFGAQMSLVSLLCVAYAAYFVVTDRIYYDVIPTTKKLSAIIILEIVTYFTGVSAVSIIAVAILTAIVQGVRFAMRDKKNKKQQEEKEKSQCEN